MLLLTALACLIWLYLLLGHGRFWQSGPELPPARAIPAAAPTVAIVVPARDEAAVHRRHAPLPAGAGLRRPVPHHPGGRRQHRRHRRHRPSLAAQPAHPHLTVLTGTPRPAGWSGKLWAVAQGVAEAGDADLILLTDADIGTSRATSPPWSPTAGDRLRPGLGNGGAALPQPGRTRPGPGFCVLLPVALSILLGQRSAARRRRRRRAARSSCAGRPWRGLAELRRCEAN